MTNGLTVARFELMVRRLSKLAARKWSEAAKQKLADAELAAVINRAIYPNCQIKVLRRLEKLGVRWSNNPLEKLNG